MKIQNQLFEKYLALLGIEKSKPTYDLLCKIVRAHLIKIPFENISKLLFKKQGLTDIPDLPTFLNGIEKYNFGGTCYTNNYYLYCLLDHLGFEIKLCGADMKNPDVHLISIVSIDSQDFIVDVGYAAPFFEPLPISLNKDITFNFGDEKYIVKPKDLNGRTRVEQHSDGKLQHWYTAKPESRKIDEFRKVIKESYSDNATFMNAIRITKFTEQGSLVLKNLYFTENSNDGSSTTKVNLEDIPWLIKENFKMPLSVVNNAIGHFKELRDIYD
jgi:N-hydroxyarylamine O-acetyltransferase